MPKTEAEIKAATEVERRNGVGQKADIIQMRFIEPGIVRYEDVGDVLIKKETLDQMAQSFVGRPVFNEKHQETTSKDFSSGRADGVVSRVWYDPSDAWFWADVAIWDPETKENCRNGYSLSCAYDVTQWSDSGGSYHNIPYAREVMGGTYTHLAIVPNPRYEGARIVYNSNGGIMKFNFWKKDGDKTEVKNASEIDGDKAILAIDGKEVPVGQLVELWNASQKAKAEAEADSALKDASDESAIEIGGKRVTLGELKNAYILNAKNDDDDEDEEKKRKAKDAEERKNAEEKDKKDKEEKDEEERKNAEEKEKKDKEDDEERKNAAHQDRLRSRANSRDGGFEKPKVMTPAERELEGSKRYGSAK